MAKKLVIVESPAKAKTIEKFLGRDFEVRASMGHIIDLPKKGLGVNTRKDFAPQYEIIEERKGVIAELKAASKKAEEVYLAPDPDREGEFIAWSLMQTLGLKNPRRAVFNEITRKAVQEAIQKPRTINEDLFNAQQARRVLDRLVGYKISPLLWRRVQSGTSAGRVQSVALRLICDRERQIRDFVPQEYWTISALLSKQGEQQRFEATLVARLSELVGQHLSEGEEEAASEGEENEGMQEGESERRGEETRRRLHIANQQEAEAILAELRGASFTVWRLLQREVRRQPPFPYTTSTMQQDASSRLYFKPKKTMSLAQQLYEGIELGPRGSQGLITYMRTDSTRVSEEAKASVRRFIEQTYGQPFVGPGRVGKLKATAQDAHEAIRPTDVTLTPEVVREYLTPDQYKLYSLIWRRFVASFMTPAVFDTVRADIVADQYVFRASGSRLRFQGFYAVWPRDEEERLLPELTVDEMLVLHELQPQQHFTQPPPRYTEASLIKELEELGIGRPSTYVPIISTIQERGYVTQEQRRFVPTWLGETVNDLLNKHFPEIVDVGFTADMEQKLDNVEEGRQSWTEFLRDFYETFKEMVARAEAEMDRVQKPVEELDELCPECGRKLVIRSGRFGRFISCSGFPECRYGRSFVNKTGALCPQCGGDLVERKTRQTKRTFYGCSNYPTCNFAIWERPVPEPCPRCGGLMVIPRGSQEPVCYEEEVLPQQGPEERPQQNGLEPAQSSSGSKRGQKIRASAEPEAEADSSMNGTTHAEASPQEAEAVALPDAPHKRTATRASAASRAASNGKARATSQKRSAGKTSSAKSKSNKSSKRQKKTTAESSKSRRRQTTDKAVTAEQENRMSLAGTPTEADER
ncbi:MAG: type I DNA topoisomerase [Thermogemmatispora sp.]|uniref:type I DNA topoisomerase n=2 Tax=Thermogemmatispora sp. TaxID=1968838 RepID=UPI001DB03321|nr:type I DNA topoisomerase [Thermogemmatispora sp.]MBX5450296.1 type I DNA topoisomerase [Thermogemmatispora sp.]